MRCSDPDAAVRKLLDGDLAGDEMREALHCIADDAEARSLLRFEVRLMQDLAASRSNSPPSEFAVRTMSRLA